MEKKRAIGKNLKEFGKEIIKLKWKQPDRLEVLLVLLYLFSWYLFNDMFNIISIEGLDTTGNFFNGIILPAFPVLILSFIFMTFVWLSFVVRSTTDESSHRMLDTFVGIWMLLGFTMMIIGLVLMLQGFPSTYQVKWLDNIDRNGIYHLGVFLFQLPGVIYFALFK